MTMTDIPVYLHAIDGRIRIKIPEIKGAQTKAFELEKQLRYRNRSIEHVKANPVTGSVLILYNPCQAKQEEILDLLKVLGYLGQSDNSLSTTRGVVDSQGFGKQLAKTVLNSTMEFVLQRLIVALV